MAAESPRLCVLGGGVAGLASAFFLQRALPHARVTVVERSARCGGLVSSARGSSGHLLEQGWHSSILVNKNGREALGLAKLLRLDDQVVSANIEASARRHLLHRGRVQLFPRVPHILGFGPALLAEPLWPRGRGEDESVHDFVRRRASAAVADRLADPVCRGQLGGEARELSARTCFPRLWFNERRFGSVFLGAALSIAVAHRQRSWLSLDLLDPLLQRVSAGGRCYSFRDGLGSLAAALEEALQSPPAGTRPAEVLRSAADVRLAPAPPAGAAAEVVLGDGRRIAAEAVVAAVPPAELARLLGDAGLDAPLGAEAPQGGAASLCGALRGVRHGSVAVVNVTFGADVFRGRFRGAGYFAGSLEEEQVLGMSWDSQLFPDAHGPPGQARLTVYLPGDCRASAEAVATEAVRRHLGITEDPVEVRAAHWAEAVPQYAVGHAGAMRALDEARVRHLPWLQLVGPGYYGTRSVADEVVDARALSDSMARRFARWPALVENETSDDVERRYSGGFELR